MILYKKILNVDNIRSVVEPTTFGPILLYPIGTKRTIKALTFGGWKTIEQIVSIKSDTNGDAYHYFNEWQNIN